MKHDGRTIDSPSSMHDLPGAITLRFRPDVVRFTLSEPAPVGREE